MRISAILLALATLAWSADTKDCAICHQRQAAAYPHSGMRNALTAARPLNRDLTLERDGFAYSLRGLNYRVTRGSETFEAKLAWSFGAGKTGITWLYEKDNRWHETRVSWYARTQALDLTVGAANERPANIAQAAGRALAGADAKECFGCHSTGDQPGLRCEACHEGAVKHASTTGPVANPGKGPAEEISEFCGRCHRTWEQVQLMRVSGINTIRFQPYRLTNSKCYDASDPRISCVACHDPHAAEVARSYDAQCQACHATKKPCPRAKSDCASCHMPKYELPGAHAKFTDHQIRIVRPGEAFPN